MQTNLGLIRTVTSACACVCPLMLQRWDTARIQEKTPEGRFVFLVADHWNSQGVLQDAPPIHLPRCIQREYFFSSPFPPGHLRELKSLVLSLTSPVSICYSEGKVPAK